MILHHLTTRAEWDAALAGGCYSAPSLEAEGFIHLSTGEQVRLTAERFYLDAPDLIVLDIDPRFCTGEIRWEEPVHDGDPGAGDPFPHLYGALETLAVRGTREVRFVDGRATLSP
ncbi:MAG: DUF952 domain-containing protein [Actinomycetia bacterium]|nr:DUF952 domain-containing protein [Actinomycetes bacterium]MCP3911462.1 DUF952 domain-containing protein [Actinomycetes bacterium]MCP4084761.1 DUF952 domain-containing protein [Actinomycetes bacterium]